MFFFPLQLPALNAFANGGGAGSCCLIKMNMVIFEISNTYPNNYPPHHHWVRVERVIVRVVVLEGKASAAQVTHLPHAQNISFIVVWCTFLCLGTSTRIGVLITERWVN